MTVEDIRYRIPAERAPEFEAAYAEAAKALAAVPECVGYDAAMPKWDWGGHPPYRG